MLIDDSDLDTFVNKRTLECSQFAKNIYVHSSAISALEFIANLITLGEGHQAIYPEMIFIDINMPLMNGFEFIEELFKKYEKLLIKPILVILTSSVFYEDRARAKALSKNIRFLNKPLTLVQLESIENG